MRKHQTLVGAAIGVALQFCLPALAANRSMPGVEVVKSSTLTVYSRPSTSAVPLAVLVEQTQVQGLRIRGKWMHVKIWDSVRGWVQRSGLSRHKLRDTVSTYQAPEIHYHVHAYPPHPIHSWATIGSYPRQVAGPARTMSPSASGRSAAPVSAWRQDGQGHVSYRIGAHWIPGSSVRFQLADPGLARVGGRPVWQRASGKGMWLTLGSVTDNASSALVSAASSLGLTHLYLESAISPLGFHGRLAVGHLIEAAHAHHISVIAWVYPYLYDVAGDVLLTRQVYQYRTKHGQRFDGIAVDLERHLVPEAIDNYSQLVRAYVGPNYLLVGVTYPPQSLPSFSFADVAHFYNVLAPMDYWHQTKTSYGLDYGHMPYGYTYAHRYGVASVESIRRVSGHVPVAPIGQAFDNFGHLEMGPHAPSASETDGFLGGVKAAGGIGVSFFQWMTVTDGEWRAIHHFHF